MAFKKISSQEVFKEEFTDLVTRYIPVYFRSVALYGNFLKDGSELYIGKNSFITVGRENPQIIIYTTSAWSNSDYEELNDFIQLRGCPHHLWFIGPDCELLTWLKNMGLIETIKTAWMPLKTFSKEKLHHNLVRHHKNIEPTIKAFSLTQYDLLTWKKDIKSLTQFLLLNNFSIIEVAQLSKVFNEKIPKNLYRAVLSTELGENIGMISKWGNIWSADHHWSFERFKSSENLTTSFHLKVIEHALLEKIDYYSLGWWPEDNMGIIQYKNYWKPQLSSVYGVNSFKC